MESPTISPPCPIASRCSNPDRDFGGEGIAVACARKQKCIREFSEEARKDDDDCRIAGMKVRETDTHKNGR
jgi:hypothetical protein